MLGFSSIGESAVGTAAPAPYSFSEPFDSGSSPWSFDTFNGTAGTLTLNTTNQLHGAGCLDVNTTLNAGRLRINAANLPLSGKLFAKFYLYVVAAPSGTSILFKHSAPSGANLMQIGYGTGLGLALRDNAGVFASSHTLTTGSWYRVEAMHDMDASKIQMRVWNSPESTGAADFDSGLVASSGTPDLLTLGQDSSVTSHHRIDSFQLSTVDWIGPDAGGTPLTGTPVPAILPLAAVAASGLLGLVGTTAPALVPVAAVPSVGRLGLVGSPVPALIAARATPATGTFGLVGAPAPAVSPLAAPPAVGTLSSSGGLTGSPVPALLPLAAVAAVGSLGIVGTPAPALMLVESIPATGTLGLLGTTPPAIVGLRAVPALGALSLLGTTPPAIVGLRTTPATGALGLVGTTAPAKLPLLAPYPFGTLAGSGAPPTGGSRGGAGSPRATAGSGAARAAGDDGPARARAGTGPARATSSTAPPRATGG